MSDQQHDKEFEAFLSGESGMADRYAELEREEPPPEVDAYVLAEARKAANVRRVQFGPRGGWLKPVALAATVLLSFSLVMNIVVEQPVRYEQVVVDSTEVGGAEQETKIPQQPATLRAMSDQPQRGLGPEIVGQDKIVEARKHSVPVAELADNSRGLAATQRERSSQPQPAIAEEATATVSLSARVEPQLQEFVELDTASAAPAPAVSFGAGTFDYEAGLLIVAEYIAAADTPSGRVAGTLDYKKDSVKTENAGTALASSSTLARRQAPADDLERDDGRADISGVDSESLLRDIQRLNTGGDAVAAGARLDEFLARYPDHPVSIQIHRQADGT